MVEAVVEFDYKAQEGDELTIRKGDRITDIKIQSGGWWEGTLAGKRGMFPDNFVKVMNKPDSGSKTNMQNDSVMLRPKSGRCCKVLFSYQPVNDDELQLQVDDIIDIICEVEDGWWKGKLRDVIGMFPSNFVTEIVAEDNHRPRPSSRDEASESDGERSTSVSSPDSSCQLLDSVISKTDGEPDLPVLPPKPVKEQCRVLFAYEAANSDELTLNEGDIITLVSREVQDKGWWRGELCGRVGVFPDNFVELITTTHTTEEPPKKPERTSGKSQIITTNRARDSITKPPPKSEVPPVPGKKPQLPVKKTERLSTVGAGDAPDGAGPSRGGVADFDSVERSAMLTHPTASRARAPGRRPPSSSSSVGSRESGGLANGTSPEEPPARRPWEKTRAPWMDELRLSQARKGGPTPVRPHSVHVLPTCEPPAPQPQPSPPAKRDPPRPASPAKVEATKTDNGPADVGTLSARLQLMEQQQLAFTRAIRELTQQLHEESQKRIQLEQQVNKLAELVTQV